MGSRSRQSSVGSTGRAGGWPVAAVGAQVEMGSWRDLTPVSTVFFDLFRKFDRIRFSFRGRTSAKL